MFERLIRFAIDQRWLVMLAVAAMASKPQRTSTVLFTACASLPDKADPSTSPFTGTARLESTISRCGSKKAD